MPRNSKELIEVFINISQSIVMLIMALALIYFLWGLAGYIKKSGDASARQESKKYIVYGLIGLLVMVGMWGLIGILAGTFGVKVGIPQIRI